MSRTVLRKPLGRPSRSRSAIVVASAMKRVPSAERDLVAAALGLVDAIAQRADVVVQLRRPERERLLGADQLLAREAGDPAQRRVDLADLAVAGHAEPLLHRVENRCGEVALRRELLAQPYLLGHVPDRGDHRGVARRAVSVDRERDLHEQLAAVLALEPRLDRATTCRDRGGVCVEQRGVVLLRPRGQRHAPEQLVRRVAGHRAERLVDLEHAARPVGDDDAVAHDPEQPAAPGGGRALAGQERLHGEPDPGAAEQHERAAAPARLGIALAADQDQRRGEEDRHARQHLREPAPVAVERDPQHGHHRDDAVATRPSAGRVAQPGERDQAHQRDPLGMCAERQPGDDQHGAQQGEAQSDRGHRFEPAHVADDRQQADREPSEHGERPYAPPRRRAQARIEGVRDGDHQAGDRLGGARF
jgi:hypothetical protein